MASSLSIFMSARSHFNDQLTCKSPIKKITNPSTWVLQGHENPRVFVRERVKELAMRQEALKLEKRGNEIPKMDLTNSRYEGYDEADLLRLAYDQCRELFSMQNDPFNFSSMVLRNRQKEKAICALWAWGRRTDEMIDGMNGSFANHETFDRMEDRVDEIYQGRPRDIYDIALVDTVSRYPVDSQLIKNIIEGSRMDLANKVYESFEEKYLYRYYNASSWILQMIQVMGIAPESTATIEKVYNSMVSLGVGITETDMLRDIGEDARNGQIYLPKDELKLAGVTENDIFKGRVTDNWRNLMRGQINRCNMFLDEGAKEIKEINADCRWALWMFIMVYKQDLKAIEANDYDCFSKKPMAGIVQRIATLPLAYLKSLGF